MKSCVYSIYRGYLERLVPYLEYYGTLPDEQHKTGLVQADQP